MKITIGEWKTRDGRKAEVVYICEKRQRAIGWIGNLHTAWRLNGGYTDAIHDTSSDLIEPWTDPVPWDWSTTPPWINWIAMDSSGTWFMHRKEPFCGVNMWNPNDVYHRIPESHAPKWSCDWKLSKTMRPGYKEAK